MYPDLVNTTIYSQAGLAMCQYELNDPASGLGRGPTGSITPGSGRGMGRYIAVKRAAAPNPDPRVVNSSGDNGRFRQGYAFDPAELGNIDMAFGAFHSNAYAAFSNTKVDTIADSAAVGIGTNAAVNAKQATLLFTMDAQDADATSFGEARFANMFYGGINVYYLGEQAQEVAAADFAFRGIPTQTGRYPFGRAFSLVNNGFTRAKGVKLVSHYPLTMHRYIVSGTQASVTFTLDFSPTTDETGPAIKAFRWIAATGVTENATINDAVIGTRSVTVSPLSSSFADEDMVTVLYESFDVQAAA
jgi:hypothetical protein